VSCAGHKAVAAGRVGEYEFYDKERPSLVRTVEKAAAWSSGVAISPAGDAAGGSCLLKPHSTVSGSLLRFLPSRGDLGLKFRELAVQRLQQALFVVVGQEGITQAVI
jgi:hypothetical protein